MQSMDDAEYRFYCEAFNLRQAQTVWLLHRTHSQCDKTAELLARSSEVVARSFAALARTTPDRMTEPRRA